MCWRIHKKAKNNLKSYYKRLWGWLVTRDQAKKYGLLKDVRVGQNKGLSPSSKRNAVASRLVLAQWNLDHISKL